MAPDMTSVAENAVIVTIKTIYDNSGVEKAISDTKRIARQQVDAALTVAKQQEDSIKSTAKHQVQAALQSIRQQEEYMRNKIQMSKLNFKKDLLNPNELIIYNKELARLNKQFTNTVPKTEKMAMALDRTKQRVSASRMQFQGWAMSIMFAGMAIKNAMSQIWQSSSKTFQEVMHSTEGTVTGFDMLEGSMKYLGFTLGQALEPIATFLAPVVMAIADWVTQNEETVRTIFLIAATVGSVFAVGGSTILAIAGIAEGFTKAKEAAVLLKDYDWAALGTKIQKGIGIISILWAFEQAGDAFAYFEEGDFLSSLESALSSAAAASGGLLLWKGKTTAGGAMLALAVGLDWLGKNEFFQNAGWIMGWLVAGFATVADRMVWSFSEGWRQVAADTIKFLSNGPIKFILDLAGIDVNKAIDKAMDVKTTFDWGEKFSTYMTTIMYSMREMDTDMASLKDSINKKVDDMVNKQSFDVRDYEGQAISNDWLTAQIDRRNYKNEDKLLSSIGTVNISVNQNQGESTDTFISRIVAELNRQIAGTN